MFSTKFCTSAPLSAVGIDDPLTQQVLHLHPEAVVDEVRVGHDDHVDVLRLA